MKVTVPFVGGRGDATAQQTDVDSFAVLEPTFDGFRNYLRPGHLQPTEQLLLEKANLLTLTAPEMTVLVGGLRALNATHLHSSLGVFTATPGVLTNDFFVNVLDINIDWTPTDTSNEVFEGRHRTNKSVVWKGTRNDLIFGSNSQLRALAEVYAQDDNAAKFVKDFAAAWNKVMNLDRFDLASGQTTRLFRSTAPYYETVVDLLDDRGQALIVEGEPAVVDGLEHHEKGQQLRHRRRRQRLIGVFLQQRGRPKSEESRENVKYSNDGNSPDDRCPRRPGIRHRVESDQNMRQTRRPQHQPQRQ